MEPARELVEEDSDSRKPLGVGRMRSDPVAAMGGPEEVGEPLVCRNIKVTGTRFPQKECKAAEAWEQYDALRGKGARKLAPTLRKISSPGQQNNKIVENLVFSGAQRQDPILLNEKNAGKVREELKSNESRLLCFEVPDYLLTPLQTFNRKGGVRR